MNGDHQYFHGANTNAVAGPSKPHLTSPTVPTPLENLGAGVPKSPPSPHHRPTTPTTLGLFLPPPSLPPPTLHLNGTQDLLARFNLHSAYDRYVRPTSFSSNEPGTFGMGATGSPPLGDKGKGKEVDVEMGEGGAAGQGAGDGEEDDGPAGKGEKKKKNSYKHLIKGLPGKHPMKKDDYLTTIMLVPPKQRIQITPFDVHTQEDAFAVSPEGLIGWNINTLVLESAQAREDRKKRKELRRLAKLQQTQGLPDGQAPTNIPLRAPIPTPATSGLAGKPPGTRTPQRNPSTPHPPVKSGGTPRPGSVAPRPGPAIAQANGANVQSSQLSSHSAPVPRLGSTVPKPGSAVPSGFAGLPPRPVSTAAAYGEMPRGKKRDREDIPMHAGHTNGSHVNGMTNGTTNSAAVPPGGGQAKAVVNAKAGSAGIRPRPVKKQRMDGPGQSNPHIQQQPTPQGV